MIKGAIFDVDGTLLDSMSIWEDVSLRYLADIHVQGEKNLSKKLEKMSVEEGAAYIKKRYALEQSLEEIIKGTLDIVEEFYLHEASMKEGVKELLEWMKQQGIPMVIATSSVRKHVEAAFRRLGILHYFDKIFTCSEVGEGKTKPLIYQAAGEYLHADFREIYVFEDALHALETAKKAGFFTVAVFDDACSKDWESLQMQADIAVTELSLFRQKIQEENAGR